MYINHPGPWHLFVKRFDNRGKPIMELKRQYLQEQLFYEDNVPQILQSAGSPSSTPETPEVELLTEGGDMLATENNDLIITNP